MGGKVYKYDGYGLRKFHPMDAELFVDIGAHIGSVSIMARILFPFACIVAFEPCKDNFRWLKELERWNVWCVNAALGPGTPMSISPSGKRHSGEHKFMAQGEKWWRDDTYTVDSMTLPAMFGMINDARRLGKTYMVKVDCEGGERFLLDDEESFRIMAGSVHFMIEIHPGFGGSAGRWDAMIDRMAETHSIYKTSWAERAAFRNELEKRIPKEELKIPFEGPVNKRHRITLTMTSKEWENGLGRP